MMRTLLSTLLLLFFLSITLTASPSSLVQYRSKSSLEVGLEFGVQSANWSLQTDNTTAWERTGVVELVYGREQHTDVVNNYWQLEIAYKLKDSSDIDTLLISHLADEGIYHSMKRHEGLGLGQIELEIMSIRYDATGSGTFTTTTDLNGISSIPEDIRLELSLEERRYDYLNPITSLTTADDYQFSTIDQESYVDIRWDYVEGMEYAEVEIAFWDGEIVDQPVDVNDTRIFEQAIRVETFGQHYRFELTYPAGKLYYRVRPIGRYIRDVSGDYSHRKEGGWSAVGEVTINAFEPDENWQYSTVYAEDGKSKKVISYFDESMRARQVITYLNDDDRTLVGETDYSLEGQAVLSILPVPTTLAENNLFFKPNFNVNAAGENYDFNDFDKEGGADALGTHYDPSGQNLPAGAGYYYSTANTTGGLYNDYIPDAEGFPMSQMRYKRDGTGRVAAQGGVGAFYQLEEGRETQYFYGSVSSTELRRLFGSNVGDASHYEKHLTLDANGQVSVAYVDQAGQTIATALTGDEPSNVNALAHQDAYVMTVDLMDNNSLENDVSSLDYTLVKSLPGSQTYSFEYDMTGVLVEFWNGDLGSICKDCAYELEIMVLDPEGNYLLPTLDAASAGQIVSSTINGQTVHTIKETYDSPSPSCTNDNYDGDAVIFSMQFDDLGEYRVVKRLRLISREDPEALLKDLDSLDLLPSPPLVSIDETECEFLDVNNINPLDPAVQDMINQVNESDCASLLEQMQAQISPGGVFWDDIETYFAANQVFEVVDNQGTVYTVSLVDTDSDLSTYESISFSPTISSPISLTGTGGQIYNLDDNLSNFEGDFEAIMNDPLLLDPAWIDVLVKEHREYCHYANCANSIESDNYDATLSLYINWSAWSTGTGNAVNNYSAIVNADPLASVGGGYGSCSHTDVKDDLITALDDYDGSGKTLVRYIDEDIMPTYVSSFTNLNGVAPSASEEAAQEWRYFISIYQSIKSEIKGNCASACVHYSDTNTIVLDPNEYQGQTIAQLQDSVDAGYEDLCAIMCPARVDAWMNDLITMLDTVCGID